MKTLACLALISFALTTYTLTTALAQAPVKLLEVALERSVPYQLARSDLKSASDKLERLKADPLAVKPELLEAKLGLESANVNLLSSKLDVRKNLTKELFAWLEAKDSLDLAKLKTGLAQANLAAAQVRFKSGSINQLEVNRSEADAKSAVIDQDGAETDLDGAAGNLTTRLGSLPAMNLALEPTPKPARAMLEAGLGSHPRVVEAKGRVERARLDLEIKDNEFTAQVEVSTAKTALSNAQKTFEDSKALVKVALSNAWDAYSNAVKAVPVRERSRGVAKDDFEAQQARFKKGLISKLAVLQSQVSLEQAELALRQAQHRLALSVMELAVTANTDLWK